jgi:hypothetical protein
MALIPDLCRFRTPKRERVNSKLAYAGLFVLAMGWLVPDGLAGQGLIPGTGFAVQDSAVQADSLTLAFEREVFSYPQYARRNPFASLLGGPEGPRFETLVLLGLIYSPFAGESIAVFGEGTRTVTPATANAPEQISVELTGGTYRVREGQIVGNGNVTVRTIELDRVIVDVAEFGLAETRTMTLPRATPGGGP